MVAALCCAVLCCAGLNLGLSLGLALRGGLRQQVSTSTASALAFAGEGLKEGLQPVKHDVAPLLIGSHRLRLKGGWYRSSGVLVTRGPTVQSRDDEPSPASPVVLQYCTQVPPTQH